MKKETNKKEHQIIIAFAILLLLALIGSIILINEHYKDVKEIIYFETLEIGLGDSSDSIYQYYSLASNYYDAGDYNNTIFYCEESRSMSEKHSQSLREIKSQYPEEMSEILELREEMIDTEIAYLFALYEACEYIESASRAYQYGNYAMGDPNIEGQNVAIRKHDELVEKYYQLSADYMKLRKELVQ